MPINFMRITDGWRLLAVVTIWDLHNVDNNNKAETEMRDEKAAGSIVRDGNTEIDLF